MSLQEKIELLNAYIQSNIAPILIENIPTTVFENATILKANCTLNELNGYLEKEKWIIPTWYQKVKEKQDGKINLLVIDNILSLSKEEQQKFYELLKYRKVGTLVLPRNCVILIPCLDYHQDLMNQEIYDLVAHIGV